jgi:hypothetical protein
MGQRTVPAAAVEGCMPIWIPWGERTAAGQMDLEDVVSGYWKTKVIDSYSQSCPLHGHTKAGCLFGVLHDSEEI